MIALPPVDPAEFIMKSGDAMQKCIDKYFSEITLEEAARPEALDPKYAPEMLAAMQAEYYKTLETIWNAVPIPRGYDFKDVYRIPALEAAGDPATLQEAYDAAVKRTLWEKLGKNYEDVMAYKLLLKEYGERLLRAMQDSFAQLMANTVR